MLVKPRVRVCRRTGGLRAVAWRKRPGRRQPTAAQHSSSNNMIRPPMGQRANPGAVADCCVEGDAYVGGDSGDGEAAPHRVSARQLKF